MNSTTSGCVQPSNSRCGGVFLLGAASSDHVRARKKQRPPSNATRATEPAQAVFLMLIPCANLPRSFSELKKSFLQRNKFRRVASTNCQRGQSSLVSESVVLA